MNLRSFLFIGLLGFVFVFGASNASGQGSTVMQVEIPFDFVIGKRTLPAGNYDVKLKETSGNPYVTLRSTNGGKIGLALVGSVNPVAENTDSGLTFLRSGEKHILSGLKVAGRNINHQLVLSKQVSGAQLAGRAVVIKPLKS